MITKKVTLICLLLLMDLSVFSQEQKYSGYLKDVNGIPFLNQMEGAKYAQFVTESCNVLTAYSNPDGIDFNGGKEAFKSYIDSCYYNQVSPNHKELNIWITFFVLVDKNAHVKDVRIVRPKYAGYDNNQCNFDNLFIEAVKSTKNRWTILKNGEDVYVYMQRLRLN